MGHTGTTDFADLIQHALTTLRGLPERRYSFNHQHERKRALDATLLAQAAHRLGLQVLPLTDELQILSNRRQRLGIFMNMPWTLTLLDRRVTNDKELTKRILREHGIPVARGGVAHTEDEARQRFHEIGPPVVVKPISGSGGTGITVGVRDEAELVAAVAQVPAKTRRILIEESIPSVDLRIMVVAGRAVAAMLRVPANVEGDGVSTIAELVARKNRLRQGNAYLTHVPIEITEAVVDRLHAHGLTPDSVLPAGERRFLHYKANLSAGGDSLDITGRVHPEIVRLAERAAACFDSVRHAGVDLLCEQFDQPPDAQRCVVSEINCNNDLPIHVFPLFGEPIDVARLELEGYFGQSSRLARWRWATRRWVGAEPSRPTPRNHRRRGPARATLADWPDLANDLAKPMAGAAVEADARSPRAVDARWLTAALARMVPGATAQAHNRLIHLRQSDTETVLARSRTSMFTLGLARRPEALHRLLATARVPVCAAARFRAAQWEEAREFFRTAPGPWNLRPAAGALDSRGRYGFRREATLAQAWARLQPDSPQLILEQTAEQFIYQLLLVDDQIAARQLVVPFGVVGDGATALTDLLAQKVALRAAHPLLRHHPAPAWLHADHRLAERGFAPDSVPAAGQWRRLTRSPVRLTHADTISVGDCPAPWLAELARAVRSLVGDPSVLAVRFAARPTGGGGADWAVAGIDPDPVLAQFAWPWAGEAPGGDLYQRVAEVLRAGQSYTLPAED